ncbi:MULTISPECIES: hypothetical protein [Clostridium]|uniref:hypothetical protein n=1 Tax=Clostridium TaxID=1485 RepID=UPI000309937D|nr:MULTISPECIES: hypothetical protein [Clostridium]MBU5228414.1 hypothetical protein [Clostridium senegalense]
MAKKGMKRYYEHRSKEEVVPEIQGKAKSGNAKAGVEFHYTTPDRENYTETHKLK